MGLTIAEAARDAAIALNNAAIRADEDMWRKVQREVARLERLTQEATPAGRAWLNITEGRKRLDAQP